MMICGGAGGTAHRRGSEECKLDGAYMPQPILSKYAREERAKVIAALESLGAPSNLLEQIHRSEPPVVDAAFLIPPCPLPAFHRLEGKAKVIAVLESLGAPSNLLKQIRKSESPVVDVAFSIPCPLPAFHGFFKESPEKWGARASADTQRVIQKYVADLRAWKPIDESITGGPITEPRRRRGPGGKRRNADIKEVYDWSAKRILGHTWKDILTEYSAIIAPERVHVDTVRHAATRVLTITQLDKFIPNQPPT
jgi:hypothetical protein